jgi:hypothetical protein
LKDAKEVDAENQKDELIIEKNRRFEDESATSFN